MSEDLWLQHGILKLCDFLKMCEESYLFFNLLLWERSEISNKGQHCCPLLECYMNAFYLEGLGEKKNLAVY